ncbi:E3 ubiquitin-protein ligase [Acrasis kona]|uniref:E3 ubiquitin-protein ligase n=1 Tax=Acrasis kona TaxID=1008807 RepID=A0AAW2ZGS4_9EUKA
MKVSVVTVLDGVFDVVVDETDSIQKIKEKISSTKGYPSELITLVKNGIVLKDQKVTNDFKDGCHIILLMKIDPNTKTYMTKQVAAAQQQQSKQSADILRLQQQFQQYQQQHPPVRQQVQAPTQQRRQLTLNDIQFNEQSVQIIMDAGFSRERAKKALFLSDMDTESAFNWIIENMEDPNIDLSLTSQQIEQIVVSKQREMARNQNQPVDPEVQQAINHNVCTYCVTGNSFVNQKWFMCKTCGLSDGKGCCETCAKICHAGHELSESLQTSFFCDCGAGQGKSPCRSLNHSALGEDQEMQG